VLEPERKIINCWQHLKKFSTRAESTYGSY
jgi:hypothetical protein